MGEHKTGTLVVLSGPSGVGKSTLVARALEALPELSFSVSVTTRPARPNERDGVDYRFVDEEAFEALAARGGLLERAVVHGRHYGTPRDAVHDLQAQGRTVLLDIDTQGADQVRSSGEPATFVFILPPDAATLEARLQLRGTENPAAVALRLSRARAEMERAPDYEFVVVNDDLERAARDLIAVLRAAVLRARRNDTVRDVLA
jgi:guanylate kinase